MPGLAVTADRAPAGATGLVPAAEGTRRAGTAGDGIGFLAAPAGFPAAPGVLAAAAAPPAAGRAPTREAAVFEGAVERATGVFAALLRTPFAEDFVAAGFFAAEVVADAAARARAAGLAGAAGRVTDEKAARRRSASRSLTALRFVLTSTPFLRSHASASATGIFSSLASCPTRFFAI